MNCWHCGRIVEVGERVGFRDYCPGCDRPLHVCRNCRFHDHTFNNQCREPMAERVVDKERGNFCEYFAPAGESRASTGASARSANRAALDNLFKKKG